METVRAAGKEIGGGASSGGISGGNRLRVLFSGAVCAKSGLSGYGYAVGNFRMEHEPDGIVFILPAKKAWDRLKEEYQGNDRTRQMQVLNLKREFESLNMQEDETISKYVDRISLIVNKLDFFVKNL